MVPNPSIYGRPKVYFAYNDVTKYIDEILIDKLFDHESHPFCDNFIMNAFHFAPKRIRDDGYDCFYAFWHFVEQHYTDKHKINHKAERIKRKKAGIKGDHPQDDDGSMDYCSLGHMWVGREGLDWPVKDDDDDA